MSDLIRQAMQEAVKLFGGESDGMFNAACFSTAFIKLAGVRSSLDGHIVRAMLTGRPDVIFCSPGSSHYYLKMDKVEEVRVEEVRRSVWERLRVALSGIEARTLFRNPDSLQRLLAPHHPP